MSPNVPAVCDVFAGLQTVGLQPCKNVGGMSRGRRNRPSRTEPWSARMGAERIQTCYVPFFLFLNFIHLCLHS
jgi:hypothetical protein